MEKKDNPLSSAPSSGSAAQEKENNSKNLLKQKINSFLISYFSYLTWPIAFIIFAAGLYFFAYPEYQQITKDNETAKNNLQIEYEAKYNYLSTISNLKKSYQLISAEDRKKIETMVPVGQEVSGLIPEIESIVLKNGAVLNSVRVEAQDPNNLSRDKVQVLTDEKKESLAGIFQQLPEGVARVKIEANLSSVNYPVLKNIIKTFESNLRLLDIAMVDYAVEENKVNLTIYAYYLTE